MTISRFNPLWTENDNRPSEKSGGGSPPGKPIMNNNGKVFCITMAIAMPLVSASVELGIVTLFVLALSVLLLGVAHMEEVEKR